MSEETQRKTKILLADGHYIVRQGMRRIFEDEPGFQVVGEANDGEQAVRLARELRPDIIVMDVRLGKVDSVETTKRIKAQNPEVAILVLTAYDDEQYVVDMRKAGAGGCLLKSADGDKLVKAIRFIREGMFVSDPLMEQRLVKRMSGRNIVDVNLADHLTRREFQVLRLAAKRMSNRNIAYHLGLTEGTVKGHCVHIFSKMGVSSRTEAVLEAIKRGWVSLEDASSEAP
ncbi:MAG: response regulator transcription factor [Chloroflexota bacterium]